VFASHDVLTYAYSREQLFHIAFELKTDKKGDFGGAGRGAIQDAVTQVFRGINGFIEFLSQNEDLVPKEKLVQIVPVIFTTAKIWTSMVDISITDIETGNSNVAELNATEREWIWYRYPLSPGIKHAVRNDGEGQQDLSGTFEALYGRSVAIVSPKGIDDFLSHTW
jgi:hypothetical protein